MIVPFVCVCVGGMQLLHTLGKNQECIGKREVSGQVIRQEKGASPLNLRVLEEWLACYPRVQDSDYLYKGFQFGLE